MVVQKSLNFRTAGRGNLEITRQVNDLVRETGNAYDAYKLRHGRLDFSDLEVLTARLLAEHPGLDGAGWPVCPGEPAGRR